MYNRPIKVSIEMCKRIVKATLVLHNSIQMMLPVSQRRHVHTDFVDELGAQQAGSWNISACNLVSVGRLGSNNSSRSV